MTPTPVAPQGHTSMTLYETEQWIRVLGNDQCSRCHGLMVVEWSDDLIAPVVLRNRQRQQTGTLGA